MPLPRSSSLGFSSAAFWIVLSGSRRKWELGQLPSSAAFAISAPLRAGTDRRSMGSERLAEIRQSSSESAPAEACLKREGCLRFGDDTLPAEGGEHLERARVPPETTVLRYATTLAARVAGSAFTRLPSYRAESLVPLPQSSASSLTRKNACQKDQSLL